MRNCHIIAAIIAIVSLHVVNSQIISCPVLVCDSMLDLDVCFVHDGQQPVETIRAYACEGYSENTTISGTPICDFNLQKAEQAWYDEATQSIDKSSIPTQSALYQKKTTANCRDISGVYQMLNNGRSCVNSSQCFSKNCYNGACKGRDRNEYCHLHADCENGLYCKQDSNWPFKSYCEKANTNYEQCSEDEECGTSAYCWYVSSEDRSTKTKKCLPLYSQEKGTAMGWYAAYNKTNLTYADFEKNGRYCKSGLAFPVTNTSGNCTAVDKVRYNSKNLPTPYPCNPTNQSMKCELVYNASEPNNEIVLPQQFFKVSCGCALDGNNGYCSKILGTTEYIDAMEKLKKVLEASNCHTLDRHDMRAQRDLCGIGQGSDIDDAVSALFRINYWPQVNSDQTSSCINSFFGDSLSNQQKTNSARPLLVTLLTSLLLAISVLTLV